MRAHRFTLSALALLASVSLAVAQQQAPANQATNPIGDGPFKSQQGGKEEPGSHQSGANNDAANDAVFVNGKLNVAGAPQDSQTVPAKYSKHNAEIDALPIMAMPLGLSDAQKHRIADSVAKSDAPVEAIDAKPADILPVTTQAAELPKEVTAEIPGIGNVKFIRTKDKILLVRPSNMVVVEAISK
jgi:hypothetical protein